MVMVFDLLVWGSKPLGGSKVNSTFYPFEVDQMSIRKFLGVRCKNLKVRFENL